MNNLNDFIVTNSNARWPEYVDGFIEFVKSKFITYADFSRILEKCIVHPESKIGGLELAIDPIGGSTNVFRFSKILDQTGPKDSLSHELDAYNWFQCDHTIWYLSVVRGDGTAKDQIKNTLIALLDAFWKKAIRDDATRIWTLKVPETKSRVNNTITYYRQNARYVSFLYCDLDKFKELNDTHGSHAADVVLLQMSTLYTSFVVDKPAILLHDKGDEFVILVFTSHIEDALSVTYDLQKVLQSAQFTVPTNDGVKDVGSEITFGFSIKYAEMNDDISYLAEIKNAENAIKIDSIKQYRKANLYNSILGTVSLKPLDEYSANVSKINLKVLPGERIFKNIWLNFIIDKVRSICASANFEDQLKAAISWIDPVYSDTCASFFEYTSSPDFSKQISAYDILIAVARGFVYDRLNEFRETNFSIKHESGKMSLSADSAIIFTIECTETMGITIGTFFQTHLFPVALLIKIGHDPLDMPKNIFGKTITIDHRPSQGGGLPDFWELALAKVVQKLYEDINLKLVYIIGDVEYAKKSVQWLNKFNLNEIGDSEMEGLVAKTRTTYPVLNHAKARLAGVVKTFRTEREIVLDYSSAIADGASVELNIPQPVADKPTRFLKKDIRIAENGLTMRDGFRVKTLAEAYPLMLEIARQASNENDSIRDQASAMLGELIDFKVELSNPTANLIPYYYRDDAKNFEEYYQSLFVNKEGLFAKFLQPQVEPVLKHLKESLGNEKQRQYSTRRAILIIPNPSTKKMEPLGLVSVRIIPRVKGPKKLELIFSYTWRTVEALVGFPYSLYGSVRYSEHLTEMLENLIKPDGVEVSFETVSYIANSLHIFMDERGQEIAKSIINDASV